MFRLHYTVTAPIVCGLFIVLGMATFAFMLSLLLCSLGTFFSLFLSLDR